jgi:hypothetical protein
LGEKEAMLAKLQRLEESNLEESARGTAKQF